MDFLSPAKVNLGLRVTGRRKNGYHELSMLNTLIDLADTVSIAVECGTGVSVVVTDAVNGQLNPDLSCADKNFAGQAAQLVLDEAGLRASVAIRINKSIPTIALISNLQ